MLSCIIIRNDHYFLFLIFGSKIVCLAVDELLFSIKDGKSLELEPSLWRSPTESTAFLLQRILHL
jgi:hypothetical protein